MGQELIGSGLDPCVGDTRTAVRSWHAVGTFCDLQGFRV